MSDNSGIERFRDFLHRVTDDPRDDRELLNAFVVSRDESAFAVLVRRHGGMVRAVGRRLLRDEHAAEDVAQAAFLVLARRSGSLGKVGSLGGWLHEVARRCALKVSRREGSSPSLSDVPEAQSGDDPSANAIRAEWSRMVDEEIGRLPPAEREAVILHYLEGASYAETSRRLGWPRGTLATRLARARELLRERLIARGVDLSAPEVWGMVAAMITPWSCPNSWAEQIVRSAKLFTLGNTSAIPAGVLRLSQEMMIMQMTKWKVTTALVGLCAVIGLATAQQPGSGRSGAREAADYPVPPRVNQDHPQQYLDLLRERVERMSAEELKKALQEELAAKEAAEAMRQLEEIRQRLQKIVENYPDTQAAGIAQRMLQSGAPREDSTYFSPYRGGRYLSPYRGERSTDLSTPANVPMSDPRSRMAPRSTPTPNVRPAESSSTPARSGPVYGAPARRIPAGQTQPGYSRPSDD